MEYLRSASWINDVECKALRWLILVLLWCTYHHFSCRLVAFYNNLTVRLRGNKHGTELFPFGSSSGKTRWYTTAQTLASISRPKSGRHRITTLTASCKQTHYQRYACVQKFRISTEWLVRTAPFCAIVSVTAEKEQLILSGCFLSEKKTIWNCRIQLAV